MKTTWKDPNKNKIEIARFYWILTVDLQIHKARLINDLWQDKNYIVIDDVILYADVKPPLVPDKETIEEILNENTN